MDISNRFRDRLLASTDLNPALVPGLDNKGLVGPIVSPLDLSTVAQNIKVNLQAANESASHARPSMFANISSFCQNVKDCLNAVQPGKAAAEYNMLSESARQNFLEWQGMIAVIALNQMYSSVGIALSVERMDLSADSYAEQCILREMSKDGIYRDAITGRTEAGEPTGGYMFYICQRGIPFAIFHPELGLCPMKQYDSSVFRGILPWYDYDSADCHKGWKAFLEEKLLDDACIARIAWWARENGISLYSQYLKAEAMPDSGFVSPVKISNARSIDQVPHWEGKGEKFGTAMAFYRNSRGEPCALPELFLDSMLLSYVKNQESSQLVYRGPEGSRRVCFRDCPAELSAFAPVTPLKSTAVEVLEKCSVNQVVFEAKMELGKLRCIYAVVQLKNQAGECLTLSKMYTPDRIRQGRLPYLMVWPFVPMPENQDFWKSYYATWHEPGTMDHEIPEEALLTCSGGQRLDTAARIRYAFDSQGILRRVNRATADNAPWHVCKGTGPFRYARVCGLAEGQEDLEEMGMVFVPAYPVYNPDIMADVTPVRNEPVVLSVDFGTTSTVCAIRRGKGAIEPLPFKDYSQGITWDDQPSKEKLDMEQWLGNTGSGSDWKWDQKFFSVAQLLERGDPDGPNFSKMPTGSSEYYVDGRLFLVSGEALARYSAPIPGVLDPLNAQQIMTDMKFIDRLDTQNYHAASLFLAGIYEYTVLHLLDRKLLPSDGCDYIEIRASYPNGVTLEALRRSWRYAGQIVGKDLSPKLAEPIGKLLENQNFYHEATAASVYQQMSGPLKYVSNLLFMDVGGGTTDISLSGKLEPDHVRKLSMRYAGREIMVSSLVEYFRKFSKNSDIVREDTFKKLWTPDSILAEQFLDICGNVSPGMVELKGLTENSSARMSIEMLLAEGMHLKDLRTGDIETVLLRELITVKFLMLLMVTARFVRNNIDLWRMDDGRLKLVGGKVSVDMAIGGTSAQMLQYIFDCGMEDMIQLQQPLAEDPDTEMDRCRALFNEIFTAELRDVPVDSSDPTSVGVGTDLKIYVDRNVSQKLEVCYGMLNEEINRTSDTMKKSGNRRELSEAERTQLVREMDRKLRMFPEETLDRFIQGTESDRNHCLMHYLTAYERIFFPSTIPVDRGLGGKVNHISDLLRMCTAMLPQSQNSAADDRAAYMVEPDQEPYRELMACMYLVEDCINWQMANLQ